MDTDIMRWAFISALLAGTAPGIGYAGPSADRGIVESVREVQLAEPFGCPGVFELALKPPTADELRVQLDDGQVITIVHTGTRLFEAGQRVRLVTDPRGTRVEPADSHTSFQPYYP
jgi:hypothetical protein